MSNVCQPNLHGPDAKACSHNAPNLERKLAQDAQCVWQHGGIICGDCQLIDCLFEACVRILARPKLTACCLKLCNDLVITIRLQSCLSCKHKLPLPLRRQVWYCYHSFSALPSEYLAVHHTTHAYCH